MPTKITVDTSILVPIGKEEISWNEILDVFIDRMPVEVFVTSAALQEFLPNKPYPERIHVLKDLKSRRAGHGCGLYGQGMYGGTTINETKAISSLFTVGLSEIGAGDCIASEEEKASLDQILHQLTNGSCNGWDYSSLSKGQIRQYRDAQAFEAHMRYGHNIFLTNDSDFNKLKSSCNTSIMSFNEFQLTAKKSLD